MFGRDGVVLSSDCQQCPNAEHLPGLRSDQETTQRHELCADRGGALDSSSSFAVCLHRRPHVQHSATSPDPCLQTNRVFSAVAILMPAERRRRLLFHCGRFMNLLPRRLLLLGGRSVGVDRILEVWRSCVTGRGGTLRTPHRYRPASLKTQVPTTCEISRESRRQKANCVKCSRRAFNSLFGAEQHRTLLITSVISSTCVERETGIEPATSSLGN